MNCSLYPENIWGRLVAHSVDVKWLNSRETEGQAVLLSS